MVTFIFDLDWQLEKYNSVKRKVKNSNFYQRMNFYVLPFMPEKFRNRVVFLPEKCEPEKIYKKQKINILKLQNDWEKEQKQFIKKIVKFFPKVNSINIEILPTFYGTIGSYKLLKNDIKIHPRFDRNIRGLKRLIITALTHYFLFDASKLLENNSGEWKKKQAKAEEIEKQVLEPTKQKYLTKALDTEFIGKLAEESASYLEKLRASSKFEVEKPNNLTKKEKEVFNLLLRNKNKLVSFDQIANEMWEEKADEKYSEYAITTLIKKLKRKVKEKNGRNLVHSQRGIGYILYS